MDDNTHTTQVKLSPAASIAVLVILILGAGGVYLVKPELFNKYLGQATNTSMKSLPQESYLPQIEDNMKVMLKGALITKLAASGASQADFNAIKDIKITSTSADPRGYFKNELSFWHQSDLRYVDLDVKFTAGGKSYRAEGTFTVTGANDRVSLSDIQLVK